MTLLHVGRRAGQLAERILGHEQSRAISTEYLGIDLSPNMVAEAAARLKKFGAWLALLEQEHIQIASE